MDAKAMRRVLVVLLAALALGGCGQKGPLYLPSPKPAPTTPQTFH